MLVLTRKTGEEIVIHGGGTTIRVRILEVREKTVVIGVEAPREINVDREEIYSRKMEEEASDVGA